MKNNPHHPNFFLKPKPGTCNQEKQQFVLEILKASVFIEIVQKTTGLNQIVKLGVIL